ncbi:hypothetical protein [Burkholderia alba]|nr:hypothetical protein [Burkholderia alba]
MSGPRAIRRSLGIALAAVFVALCFAAYLQPATILSVVEVLSFCS